MFSLVFILNCPKHDEWKMNPLEMIKSECILLTYYPSLCFSLTLTWKRWQWLSNLNFHVCFQCNSPYLWNLLFMYVIFGFKQDFEVLTQTCLIWRSAHSYGQDSFRLQMMPALKILPTKVGSTLYIKVKTEGDNQDGQGKHGSWDGLEAGTLSQQPHPSA